MSLASAVIDALIAAGCTAEQLGAAMKAANAADDARREAKRENNAERQRRYRERHKDEGNDSNALQDVTERDSVTESPLSRPPNEEISNPPTHTPPDMTSRPRKGRVFPMLDCTDAATWADFLTNRAKKRLPNTASAHRKLLTDLAAMSARTGWPPGKVFAACVEQGWGAIYETDEMKGAGNGRLSGQNNLGSIRGNRPNPALDMLLEAERDIQAEAQRENSWTDRTARIALPSH